MGQSADAKLFYGVNYGESLPWLPDPEEVEDWEAYEEEQEKYPDLDDWVCRSVEHLSPYDDMPDEECPYGIEERKAWDARHPDWVARQEAYFAARHKLQADCPIEQVGHGYEYSHCALALKGTTIWASWGDEEIITPERLVVPENAAEAIEWTRANLPLDEFDPQWIMLAAYG